MASDQEYAHYLDFITNVAVAPGSIEFFSSQPCAQPYLSSQSSWQPIPFATRFVKKDTSDSFFSQTLNTNDTISHALACIQKDILQLRPKLDERTDEATPAAPDVVYLVHLGSKLNGFRDTVHGGILASLLDEAFSCCVESLRCSVDLVEKPPCAGNLYTVNLNITYRMPASSPGVYIVEAGVRRRSGRKWFLDARVVGEDGKVRVEATSLWIQAKRASVL